jgi:hypothetical protein
MRKDLFSLQPTNHIQLILYTHPLMGEVEATGTLGAKWGGKTPMLTGALAFPELDFSSDSSATASANTTEESAPSAIWC